jgi:hypothetical protein
LFGIRPLGGFAGFYRGLDQLLPEAAIKVQNHHTFETNQPTTTNTCHTRISHHKLALYLLYRINLMM